MAGDWQAEGRRQSRQNQRKRIEAELLVFQWRVPSRIGDGRALKTRGKGGWNPHGKRAGYTRLFALFKFNLLAYNMFNIHFGEGWG